MSPVRRPRTARVTPAAGLLVLVVLVAGLTACTGDASSTPSARPTASAVDEATTLEDVDTTALVVKRAPFCDLIDPAAVGRALGRAPEDASAYRSGQRTKISPDVTDVVHEYGCVWTAGDATAKAWVFAPPITRRRAEALADVPLCGDSTDEPAFGAPSEACQRHVGDRREAFFQGLFGDAWLSCSLSDVGAAESEFADRADRWCAAVATGAASPAG